MFCTGHTQQRPVPVRAAFATTNDRRVRSAQPKAPRHVFTDWASI